MPEHWLTEVESLRLTSFPEEMPEADVVTFFTLNRLKLLARIGKRATNQALERMLEERRYPILVAFLSQTVAETIDEAVDLFDRCLAEADSRAGRELD
jgi:hypothetical protein